eukprot:165555_1
MAEVAEITAIVKGGVALTFAVKGFVDKQRNKKYKIEKGGLIRSETNCTYGCSVTWTVRTKAGEFEIVFNYVNPQKLQMFQNYLTVSSGLGINRYIKEQDVEPWLETVAALNGWSFNYHSISTKQYMQQKSKHEEEQQKKFDAQKREQQKKFDAQKRKQKEQENAREQYSCEYCGSLWFVYDGNPYMHCAQCSDEITQQDHAGKKIQFR